MSDQPITKANANATLISGVVLVLAAMVAYIYCEQVGINSVPVLGFAGPFAGALLIAQRLEKVQQVATQARDQATTAVRQTNGELSDRVRTIVRDEIKSHQIERDVSKAALSVSQQPAG